MTTTTENHRNRKRVSLFCMWTWKRRLAAAAAFISLFQSLYSSHTQSHLPWKSYYTRCWCLVVLRTSVWQQNKTFIGSHISFGWLYCSMWHQKHRPRARRQTTNKLRSENSRNTRTQSTAQHSKHTHTQLNMRRDSKNEQMKCQNGMRALRDRLWNLFRRLVLFVCEWTSTTPGLKYLNFNAWNN